MPTTRESLRGVLDQYFGDIGKIMPLDRREEREIAREIRSGHGGALNRLVEANLGFVIKIASDYRRAGLAFEDLVGAGNLGLIVAARRFDLAKRVRFTTYAAFWVRKAILDAVAEQSRVVQLPAYHSRRQREILLAERSLRRTLGRQPSRGEIAEHLRLTSSRVDRVLRHGGHEFSLDDPLENAPGAILRKRLTDLDEDSIERRLDRGKLSLYLRRFLMELDERHRTVLMLHYGLDAARPRTLLEISRRLGVTRERVRQIEREAIRSLRGSWDRERRRCAQRMIPRTGTTG